MKVTNALILMVAMICFTSIINHSIDQQTAQLTAHYNALNDYSLTLDNPDN